jgi:hypothetical protein
MKKSLLVAFACLALTACKKDRTTDNKFRIQNNTSTTIDSVYVKMGTGENRYGVIQPNQYSVYKSFAVNDRPLIRISSGGQITTLRITLIDNNGGGVSSPSKQPLNTTCVIEMHNNRYDVHFESE